MIRHVVLFNIVGTTQQERTASFTKLAAALRPLATTVPNLKSLRLDADSSGIDTHWDAMLTTEHETWNDLAEYQSHPAHLAAVGVIDPVVIDRAVVDAEV